MRKKPILPVLLILPLFLFMGAEEGGPGSGSLEFIGKVANFILLFGALAYLLRRPIRNFLESRVSEAAGRLREARDGKETAERDLRQAEERLQALAAEVKRISEEAESQGLKERERISARAQKEAGRVKSLADLEIKMLSQAGIKELKYYTAELACSLALERIKRKITPQVQSYLIERSLERLENLYEKTNPDQEIHPGPDKLPQG